MMSQMQDLSVDKTSTDEDVRSNVLTGRKLAFGHAVTEQKDANNSGSKTSSGAKKICWKMWARRREGFEYELLF